MAGRQILVSVARTAAFAAILFTLVHCTGKVGKQSADAPAGERQTVRFLKNPAPVPAFTGRTLDGREIDSRSLAGKVMLVNFWATWCPPCRAEIPDLVALQEKYRDQLQIIGVLQDESSTEDVKRFVAEYKINYPVLVLTPELERVFPRVFALP